MEGQHRGMDRPVDVIIATHRGSHRGGRWAIIAVDASVGVPPITPAWAPRVLVSYLAIKYNEIFTSKTDTHVIYYKVV